MWINKSRTFPRGIRERCWIKRKRRPRGRPLGGNKLCCDHEDEPAGEDQGCGQECRHGPPPQLAGPAKEGVRLPEPPQELAGIFGCPVVGLTRAVRCLAGGVRDRILFGRGVVGQGFTELADQLPDLGHRERRIFSPSCHFFPFRAYSPKQRSNLLTL
mgnify:CR=1 FL=1